MKLPIRDLFQYSLPSIESQSLFFKEDLKKIKKIKNILSAKVEKKLFLRLSIKQYAFIIALYVIPYGKI